MSKIGAVRSGFRSDSGVSIVELVVAIFVLGITMLGVATMVINSLGLARSNANRVVAANIAASEIEHLLTLSFDELLALVPAGEEELDPVDVDGRSFDVVRHVYWSTNEADVGPCITGSADAADENVLRIDVSVSWTRTLGVQPVTSSTTVSPPVDTFGAVGGTIAVYVVDHENQPVQGARARLYGPVETSSAPQPEQLTDENGCAVFEGLALGTYKSVVARPEGFTGPPVPPFVDLDQRISPYASTPVDSASVEPEHVTSLTGVSPRSRVTTQFFYAQGNAVTLTPAGWDGGTVPDSEFTWSFGNTRGAYFGGEFGTPRYVYPGEYEIWPGECRPPSVEEWIVADEAGGSTTSSLTYGSFDVTWDNPPDPSRAVELVARWQGDSSCIHALEIALGPSTVGAPDLRFALPWGEWEIAAIEQGNELTTDTVTLARSDIDDGRPHAELFAPELPLPGPNGVLGPTLWLDASLASTLSGDAGAISQWRDVRTEVLRLAQQDDDAHKPTYVDSVLNGLHAVRFSGAEFLSFDGEFLADTDYTIFVASRRSSGAEHNFYLGGTSTVPGTNLYAGYTTSTALRHSHVGGGTYDSAVAAYSTEEPARIHTFLLDETVGKVTYQDGALVGSSSSTDRLASFGSARLGAVLSGTDTQYFRGDIGEIVIYPRALTDSERALVESYLIDKWVAAPEPPPAVSGPNDLTGLAVWWDADAASDALHGNTDCSGGGSSIACMRDLSGNGRHATQSSSTHRPRRLNNAMNGRRVAEFTGARYLLFDGSFLANTDYTVVVVSRRTHDRGDNFNFYMGGMNGGTGNDNLHLGYRNNTSVDHAQWSNDYASEPGAISGFVSGEPARLHTYRLDQTSGKSLYQNGTLVGWRTDDAGRQPLVAFPNATLGRFMGDHFHGYIAEVVIYDRALTNAERVALETHLMQKWGIS